MCFIYRLIMTHGLFTRELGGTLLIVTADDRTYEVRRLHISSMLMVTPDFFTPMCSREEEVYFMGLFHNSGCATV